MKHPEKRGMALALSLAMVLGTMTAVPALAAETEIGVETEEETVLTESVETEAPETEEVQTEEAQTGETEDELIAPETEAAETEEAEAAEPEPQVQSGYVLMNIPYGKFYEAEGTSDVDAVTSATLSKTKNGNLAGGSYHVNSDGSDITGIIYPVQVSDMSKLADYTQITDESKVDITVNNHGTESTTTYEGKDALFEAPSYAYYVLSGEPSHYKVMNADGSFGEVKGSKETVEGVTAEVTTGGHHTDIEIVLDGTTGVNTGAKTAGVVLTDKDGKKYGLQHVYNIWRGTELGWNWEEKLGEAFSGNTIKNITYYLTADNDYAVYSYPVDIYIKPQAKAVTAAFDAKNSLTVTGLPTDIKNPAATVQSKVGRGQTPVVIAEKVPVTGGKIAAAEDASFGTTYQVTIVSDNYADIKVETTLLFTDAAYADRYFFEPVYWAAQKDITVGFGGPMLFSPDANCTREQIVTFLWRMMGQPEPEKIEKFADVKADAWYAKSISWAYEEGITVGLNDGTGRFGVGQTCTREMCVTFLHRAAGNPAPAGKNEFTDMRDGAYYIDPVTWASENGVTVGLNDGTGRFGIGRNCTRAMIVTFLYRYSQLGQQEETADK